MFRIKSIFVEEIFLYIYMKSIFKMNKNMQNKLYIAEIESVHTMKTTFHNLKGKSWRRGSRSRYLQHDKIITRKSKCTSSQYW
jgi:hypothetical protein